MGFGKDVSSFSVRAIRSTEKAHKLAAINLFTAIIKKTPVGNSSTWKNPKSAPKGYTGGTLRGSWFLTFARASPKKGSANRDGSAVTEMASKISKAKVLKYLLTNNQPYAKRVENGWSDQAPQGMVRLNVAKWKSFVKKAAKAVKGKNI